MSTLYEIHVGSAVADRDERIAELPWHVADHPPRLQPLEIAPGESVVWTRIDRETHALERSGPDGAAELGFRMVRRRLLDELAMIVRKPGVLVNGLPALELTILAVKDSLVLAPGVMAWVTQRVRPHVGEPPKELIGQKCPYCRLPIEAGTRIVTCRCGKAYHDETEEHVRNSEEEPLRCFTKVRKCLACGCPVTKDEYREWDPETL